jgi:hypothetical protein
MKPARLIGAQERYASKNSLSNPARIQTGGVPSDVHCLKPEVPLRWDSYAARARDRRRI